MMDPWWLIGLGVVMITGLIGVIYAAGQGRDDKQDMRSTQSEQGTKELREDFGLLKERVVRTETKIEIHDRELEKLRDMRHDILERVTHTLAEWYTNIMDYIREKKE